MAITFGWRVPDYPENGVSNEEFRKQIFGFMDCIHGRLDSAWVGDHFFPWPGEIEQSLDTIEAWTTMSYLAGRYPQMNRFGTIVLSQGYRPPAVLAKMSAVLQWLSGGRHVLGIGAGWKENEYRAYGFEYPADRVRLDQLEEAVQVIRAMWSQEKPTFDGHYYQIHDAYCAPRPDPMPPLLIGGSGPRRTLRIVAKYGDWCNLNNSPIDFCRDRLDTLREHCLAVGRSYDEIVKTYSCDCVAVTPTHAQAEQMREASFFGKFQDMTGTPDEVAAKIQPYIDLGITHFIFRWIDFPRTDGVELFIKEVAPRF
jgi:alkanesulfonate monooxygenase SsuD/methylene tetrahydromethanopterin reductase-like flavin-dependent oxidoreductase (luciferase family)